MAVFAADDLRTLTVPLAVTLLVLSRLAPRCRDAGSAVWWSFC